MSALVVGLVLLFIGGLAWGAKWFHDMFRFELYSAWMPWILTEAERDVLFGRTNKTGLPDTRAVSLEGSGASTNTLVDEPNGG